MAACLISLWIKCIWKTMSLSTIIICFLVIWYTKLTMTCDNKPQYVSITRNSFYCNHGSKWYEDGLEKEDSSNAEESNFIDFCDLQYVHNFTVNQFLRFCLCWNHYPLCMLDSVHKNLPTTKATIKTRKILWTTTCKSKVKSSFQIVRSIMVPCT